MLTSKVTIEEKLDFTCFPAGFLLLLYLMEIYSNILVKSRLPFFLN